jgi:hypothetical protein
MSVTNVGSIIPVTNGLSRINRMSHLRQPLFMSAFNVVAIQPQNCIN